MEAITRDAAATKMWADIYTRLSRAAPGLLGAICARAEAQTLRLSCLYALLDQSPQVGVVHLCAALAVWSYCEQSARVIFGDTMGNPLADLIQSIVNRSAEGITRTDLNHALGRNYPAAQIQQALGALEEQHRITIESPSGDGPGRPTATIRPSPHAVSKCELNELNDLIHKYLNNRSESPASNPPLITNKLPAPNLFVINGELSVSKLPNEINELGINSSDSFNSSARDGDELNDDSTNASEAGDSEPVFDGTSTPNQSDDDAEFEEGVFK